MRVSEYFFGFRKKRSFVLRRVNGGKAVYNTITSLFLIDLISIIIKVFDIPCYGEFSNFIGKIIGSVRKLLSKVRKLSPV